MHVLYCTDIKGTGGEERAKEWHPTLYFTLQYVFFLSPEDGHICGYPLIYILSVAELSASTSTEYYLDPNLAEIVLSPSILLQQV